MDRRVYGQERWESSLEGGKDILASAYRRPRDLSFNICLFLWILEALTLLVPGGHHPGTTCTMLR